MYHQQEPYMSGIDYDEDLDPGDIDEETIKAARTFLEHAVGRKYDWDGPHMARTPIRFAKMIREMTSDEPFEFTTFPNTQQSDEMVVIRSISFTALCAHHVVPFTGVAHIGYIPGDYLAGLSKFARAVRWWAKGLWVQEELTTSIANFLEQNLTPEDGVGPKGIAVVLEAAHECMTLRGIKAEGSMTVTSCMRGVFLDNTRHARQEFLALINKGQI